MHEVPVIQRPTSHIHDDHRGQALVELAILGSLLILLIGALINYGLNYDFQQQASMESFRAALGLASAPVPSEPAKSMGSATIALIKDRHIPNPSSPFATGSINPVSTSASVTRNFLLQETADTPDALPQLTLQVENVTGGCPGSLLSPAGSPPPCRYLTANFRYEFNVPKDSLEWYREVYGSVCAKTKCGGSGCEIDGKGREDCDDRLTLKIVDSCAGEIISYDGCVRQARLMNDPAFCASECEKGRRPDDDKKDCTKICFRQRSPRPLPWYAVNCAGAGRCQPLDALFTDIRNMGLQPGYVKVRRADQRLTVTDNASTSAGNLREETTRTMITQQDGVRGAAQRLITDKVVLVDGTYNAP